MDFETRVVFVERCRRVREIHQRQVDRYASGSARTGVDRKDMTAEVLDKERLIVADLDALIARTGADLC